MISREIVRLAPAVAALSGALVPLPAAAAEPVKLRPIAAVLAGADGAPLSRPEGVACAPGALVVADTGSGRVVRYDVGEEAATPREEFRIVEAPYPIRVELDAGGGLLVLDGRSRRIARVGPDGGFLGSVAAEAGSPPAAVAARSVRRGADGSLYVLDAASALVRVFDARASQLRSVAFPAGTGFVSDLAVDPAGRIYLVDSTGSRLLVADASDPVARPLTGDLRGELDFAVAIAADRAGRLFVADQNGGGIVIFGADGAYLGRQGQMGWALGELRYPSAVCADGEGRLYVADRENDRVQVFAVSP